MTLKNLFKSNSSNNNNSSSSFDNDSSHHYAQNNKMTKTVFLIRHAESFENHRLACLSRSLGSIAKLQMPKKPDLQASVELLDIPAQIDSDVSPAGLSQIQEMRKILDQDEFLVKEKVQLILHSPLKRARQTCEGMLGYSVPVESSVETIFNTNTIVEGSKSNTSNYIIMNDEELDSKPESALTPALNSNDSSPSGKNKLKEETGFEMTLQNDDMEVGDDIQSIPLRKFPQRSLSIQPTSDDNDDETDDSSSDSLKPRVVELDCLSERSPMEWLPYGNRKLVQRIDRFESWLNEQPEKVIAIVGHSQYFKSMLGLPYKFGNCDVWKFRYEPYVNKSSTKMTETYSRVDDWEDGPQCGKGHMKDDIAAEMLEDEKQRQAIIAEEAMLKDEANLQPTPQKGDNTRDVPLPRGWYDMQCIYEGTTGIKKV